jgi:hypothetical protein
MKSINVYLEIGKKRSIATVPDWPGWCRISKDENLALQALVDYGPRYARVFQGSGIDFQPPADKSVFVVKDRLEGDVNTDFGVPELRLETDREVIKPAELERFRRLLSACWQAFDRAVTAAAGKSLSKGPRGGGRELDQIVEHVLGADRAYLARMGLKQKSTGDRTISEGLMTTRQAILYALEAAQKGELPERGPRGGLIWTGRYFVRRVAWHVLDHAWEIEDRTT